MKLRFNQVIGTGGIGKGYLFLSEDNRTLGRSESRLVELTNVKDYCKLHIVFHYTAKLLRNKGNVYPIGYVGNDAYGEEMLSEMRTMGMDTAFVGVSEEYPTTLSICLQYPDKEGCNFTAGNGAGLLVTPQYIRDTLRRMSISCKTIVAAIPEVSMESRLELLQQGHKKGAFCALSITQGEAEALKKNGILQYCDLLSVNLEEAEAIVGAGDTDADVARRLWEYAAAANPSAAVIVTCGKDGAYVCSAERLERVLPMPTQAVNTTGAGDALLGGTLAALAMGYPLQKGRDDDTFAATPLASAVELGCLCAGIAVECADSIAAHLTTELLENRVQQEGWQTEPHFLPKTARRK